MAIRAIRGATQLDSDDREHLLVSVEELIREIFSQNDVDTDNLVSMILTATPDLHSEFLSAVIGAMDSSADLSAQILDNPDLPQKLLDELVPIIYRD